MIRKLRLPSARRVSASLMLAFVASAAAGQPQTLRARCMRPASPLRSPSFRTRPIAPCSSSSSRAAASASSATAPCCRPDFLDLRGAIVVRRRARPARPGVRARLRDQRPLLRQLHQPAGQHGRRAVPAIGGNPLVADPGVAVRSALGRRAGPRSSPSRSRTTTAATSRSGRTAILYIGLGDGGSGNDPEHRAQNPVELLGKMLRIDVNVADGDPTGYRVPADNPFVGGGRRRASGDLELRPAQSVALQLRRSGARRHRRAVIGDVGQNQWEEIDYEPAGRGGRNYGWRNREGAHDNVTSRAAGVSAADRSDLTSTTTALGAVDHRRLRLPRHARSARRIAAATSSPISCSGRVWSLALDDRSGDRRGARRRTCVEHTAELGGTAQLGNVSSFGVDADGELYIVSYSRGTIFKLLGPPASSGDFDDDGKADLAIFRPVDRELVHPELGERPSRPTPCGSGDSPATCRCPGDYDGDGASDLAVYRPADRRVVHPAVERRLHDVGDLRTGDSPCDLPVPGDYDGDGKTDPAVYRPSTGVWSVLTSSSNYTTTRTVTLGVGADIPVPADYDGDGHHRRGGLSPVDRRLDHPDLEQRLRDEPARSSGA